MAKPIESTPTLRGKDAKRFLKQMIKAENTAPSKLSKQIANDIKENRKIWSNYLI
jgi:hypothetical protein